MLDLKGTARKTRRHAKRTSVDKPATLANAKPHSERITTSKTTVTNGNLSSENVHVKKIDWEVPRKTLHSSIGAGESFWLS
jgi:hypothetical protein